MRVSGLLLSTYHYGARLFFSTRNTNGNRRAEVEEVAAVVPVVEG